MSRLHLVALSLLLSLAAGCAKKDCIGPAGVAVKHGAGVKAADGCNQCTCTDSGLVCTTMACAAAPADERGGATPPPTSTVADATKGTIATPPEVVPPPPPDRPTWVVAGDAGVIQIDLTGATVRTLVAMPARSPRWLPGRTKVAFFAREKNKGKDAFTDLRVLDLVDGSHRSLAVLSDAPPCKRDAYKEDAPPTLSLTVEDEFYIEAKGEYACVVFADHEADLRENWRDMAVRLSDGRVVEGVYGGEEVCGRTNEEGPKQCAGRPVRPEVESPYDNHGVHSRSPDGKWLLVDVASELGDVLHQQFVLHEVATRKLYPLPRDGAKTWPEPSRLDLAKIGDEGLVEGLGDVGGGETIEWIGDHHLVVGRTLFIAGERIVELPGDAAR